MKKVLCLFLLLICGHGYAASAEQLTGTWEGSPVAGTILTYVFTDKNTFVWTHNQRDQVLKGDFSVTQDKDLLKVEFKNFSNDPKSVIRCIIKFDAKNRFRIDGKKYTNGKVGDYPTEFGKYTIEFTRKVN